MWNQDCVIKRICLKTWQYYAEMSWFVIMFPPKKKTSFSGWWFQFLWKIWVNWDDDIPNIWENKIHVPNHHPSFWGEIPHFFSDQPTVSDTATPLRLPTRCGRCGHCRPGRTCRSCAWWNRSDSVESVAAQEILQKLLAMAQNYQPPNWMVFLLNMITSVGHWYPNFEPLPYIHGVSDGFPCRLDAGCRGGTWFSLSPEVAPSGFPFWCSRRLPRANSVELWIDGWIDGCVIAIMTP